MIHAQIDEGAIGLNGHAARDLCQELSSEQVLRMHGDKCLSPQYRIGDLDCPHCGGRTHRRSSVAVSDTYRSILYLCTNPACAHAFMASLIYEYGMSPSAIPKEGVNLPLRPSARIPGVTVAEQDKKPEQDFDPDQMTMFGD